MNLKMERRFAQLCYDNECEGVSRSAFLMLNFLYTDSARYYHGWNHISYMLNKWDDIKDEQRVYSPSAMEFAIFYHDAWYVPTANDNEYRSGKLFTIDFASHLPESIIARTTALIDKTKFPHEDINTTDTDFILEAELLRDIDLAILGSSSTEFRNYNESILREYHMYPQDIVIRKRCQMFKELLEHPIYKTPYFNKTYEIQSRTNLETYINAVEKVMRV